MRAATLRPVAALTAALALTACAPSRTTADFAPVDAQARRLMERERVEGMAYAVVDQGRIVHVAAFGRRNVERDLPLTTDTVLYGASLTKAAFAYMVLQLVDEGRLDLDASLASLLPKPLPAYARYADLATDDRWRALTPRILLTHTSGFANFRWLEHDRRLRIHADPGTRYGYSGEGIDLLQFVLEEGMGLDVGAEMQRRVFDRFAMTRTGMTWRADFAVDVADGYRIDGTMVPHDRRGRVGAAGSMDTTVADQAKLWAAMVRGDGLSAASRAEFVEPSMPIASARQFPTLAPEVSAGNARTGLSAGLGVVVFRNVDGPGWYKGGHDEQTGNMAICLETGKRCLVMLANDVRAERIYPELARIVLGANAMRWAWEYGWFAGRDGAR